MKDKWCNNVTTLTLSYNVLHELKDNKAFYQNLKKFILIKRSIKKNGTKVQLQ